MSCCDGYRRTCEACFRQSQISRVQLPVGVEPVLAVVEQECCRSSRLQELDRSKSGFHAPFHFMLNPCAFLGARAQGKPFLQLQRQRKIRECGHRNASTLVPLKISLTLCPSPSFRVLHRQTTRPAIVPDQNKQNDKQLHAPNKVFGRILPETFGGLWRPVALAGEPLGSNAAAAGLDASRAARSQQPQRRGPRVSRFSCSLSVARFAFPAEAFCADGYGKWGLDGWTMSSFRFSVFLIRQRVGSFGIL